MSGTGSVVTSGLMKGVGLTHLAFFKPLSKLEISNSFKNGIDLFRGKRFGELCCLNGLSTQLRMQVESEVEIEGISQKKLATMADACDVACHLGHNIILPWIKDHADGPIAAPITAPKLAADTLSRLGELRILDALKLLVEEKALTQAEDVFTFNPLIKTAA